MATLYRATLLDTPPEPAFDRLAGLAARLLGAPIALVSVLDDDRQFFKSAIGLPEPWASERSAPCAYGFCRHIVQSREPFAVDDARQDPFTRQNPAVRELAWVASLGVPLLTRAGHAIGAMIVVDTLPRLWSPRDAELLGELAASVVTEIELRYEEAERQRAERRAAPSEHDEPFGDPFEDAGAGIGLLSLEGRWLRVNRALAGLLGYEPEALASLTLADVTHPDDIGVEREAVRLLRGGECPSYQVETRYRRRSGETIWVLVTAAVVHRPDGEPDHLVTVVQDVTERRTDAATAPVMAALPETVLLWDLQSDRVAWRPQGAALFGYPSDVLGTSPAGWYERIHAADRERVVAGMAAALARGARHWTDHYRFRCADGSYLPINDRAVATYDETGAPVRLEATMVVADTPQPSETPAGTPRRGQEVEKMEAIARLAGGIAHEFNNLLTGVLSHADLILQELRYDDPIRDDVERIRQATLRGANRTRQLLAFSRRQLPEPEVVSLNDIVDGLRPMLHRLLGAGVTLETSLEPALWSVFADAEQLEQVVVNLVANAREAMPSGGRVTIATANLKHEGPATDPESLGEYARLSVTDTGIGMTPATQARIFEPFFTTKAPGDGPGLGLATVFGIVQQSGGEITVTSALGEGATVDVDLPRYRGATETAPHPRLPVIPRGSETVLLVDDEAEIRAATRRLLQRQGYTVLEARHGAEALHLFEANAERIALVLTDIVMPEIDGRELVERLRASCPLLKVLFMSGYADGAIAVGGRLPPNTGFLEKPFVIEELAREVRAMLDYPAGG